LPSKGGDDLPGLTTRFHVAVSLDDLVEREGSIDNGLQFALVEPAANEGDRCLELLGKPARRPDSVALDRGQLDQDIEQVEGVISSLSAP
jgi:hypothetical protein